MHVSRDETTRMFSLAASREEEEAKAAKAKAEAEGAAEDGALAAARPASQSGMTGLTDAEASQVGAAAAEAPAPHRWVRLLLRPPPLTCPRPTLCVHILLFPG